MARPTRGGARRASRHPRPTSVALLLLSGVIAGGAGAEVSFTPFVTADVNYTDNVLLAPAGAELEDTVYRVAPGFRLDTAGTRVTGSVAYQLESVRYHRYDQFADVYHDLRTRVDGQVVPDMFSVGAFANVEQVNLDTDRAISNNNIFPTGNREDVASFGVAPEFRTRLGGAGNLLARHTASRVEYSGQAINDSRAHQSLVLLDGDQRGERLGWLTRLAHTRVSYDNGQDATFGDYSLRLSYELTGKTRALFTQGYEDNTVVQQDGPGLSFQGYYWLFGVEWNPTPLQQFSLEAGDRYYGNTWRFNWQRQTRQVRTRLEYREQTTATVLEQLSGDFTGRAPQFSLDQFSNTQDSFLDKSATATLDYSLNRSTFSLRLNHREREYTVRDVTDTVSSAVLDFRWTATRLTDVIATASWRRFEYTDDVRRDDLVDYRLEYRIRMTPNLNGSLIYEYIDRDSALVAADYRANLYTAALTLTY